MRMLMCICMLLVAFVSYGQEADPFFALRNKMVKNQIERRGIRDSKILDAFRKVERHKFVPDEYVAHAYSDSPLPIDEGQTISQPYIVAYMTDALNLQSSDKVLEIGTGSGYQAAILAEICDSVFTIELFESLGKRAREIFDKSGYSNIYSKVGDGYKGWREYAPFDAIMVTASPEKIPEPLKAQLAEGGRMIIPVGAAPVQHLVILRKRNGRIKEERVLPVRFVPMIDSLGNRY
ncbi:MAG TPA: protein-L-isoaspartate(D-aspartate) O-methyltransferase [Mariniphaga sp.]|nr:protein-L-isoaspartate(D-aspartate) O-methyltransferase [Mariniphaga sp.]